MATLNTTLETIRLAFLRTIGEGYRGTTTSAGGATGNTFIDSALKRWANDKFNTWFALITSGTYDGEISRVDDFAGPASGTVTVAPVFTGQIATSVTYELMRFHPTNQVLVALNEALRECFPKLAKSILDYSLITGNALPNSDFEDWTLTTVPDHWAKSVVTLAEETSKVRYLGSSLKVTGGASAGYAYCSQAEWPSLLNLGGKEIDLEAWIYTATASHARVGIEDDDGTTWSSYHTGGSGWELLQATRTIKSSTKTILFKLAGEVNAAVAYYDRARAIGGAVHSYVMPLSFSNTRPNAIWLQDRSSEKNDDERPCDDLGEVYPFVEWPYWKVEYDDRLGLWLLRFTRTPTAGYTIKLEGQEYFTALSADTDTVAVNAPQLRLVYWVAARILYENFYMGTMGASPEEYLQKIAYARARIEELRRTIVLHTPVSQSRWEGASW